MSKWVGSIVSLDCGDSLGTYQGQVQRINNSNNTLTLSNAFRNGLKCEVPNITISSSDIRELKILTSPEDAVQLMCRKTTPSKLSKAVEESINPKCPSPVKVIHASGPTVNGFNGQINNNYSNNNFNHSNNYSKRLSPPYDYNNGSVNGFNKTNGHQRLTPTRESETKRTNGNDNKPVKKPTTPRKIESKNNRRGNQKQDCFSAPVESFINDFDFEKNLRLFDKQAEYAKIENGMPESAIIEKKPTKYRCDENVLTSGPVILQQIKTPTPCVNSYVTDSGLLIPCITKELRDNIFSLSEKYGLTMERQIEMIGRSASEMVLQLLGGFHRLSPQNGHQLPVVVILCGPHLQGAKGINCARQLANHNVKTILYVPNFVKMPSEVERELKLYEMSDGRKTSCAKDLPQGPIDMIVNALDNHDNIQLRHQTWFTSLVDWASNKRANCLAIDPPTEGPAIESKWSLSVCLPLNMKATISQVYLCDLGIPKKVFSELGIKYMSPFGHKFVIALHEKD